MQRRFALEESELTAPKTFKDMLQACGFEFGPGWPDRFGDVLEHWATRYLRKPIPTLSLFSGAGGLDIGFQQAGFDVKVAIEIEEKFTATLIANTEREKLWSSTNVLTTDIRNYNPPHNESLDFIIGGPPCQTFSAAGRRAGGVIGTSDETGALFKEYVRLLEVIKPKGFLFENVYGITGAGQGKAWSEIQAAFESIGYKIVSRVLDSADYGVPQHRERLFIVGLQYGTYEFPMPIFGPDAPGQPAHYSAYEAILGSLLPTSEEPTFVAGRYGHLLEDIPPGLNYSFYTEQLGHPQPVFSWRSKFSDFLYKADPEVPVRTIKAQGGQYTGPFHWSNRPFTTMELKRLQTFPDDYVISGGRQAVIEQIGNSVPPQLARILALSILSQVFGAEVPISLPTLHPRAQLSFRRRKRERTTQYASKAALAIANLKTVRQDSSPQERSYQGLLSQRFGWAEIDDGALGVPVHVYRGVSNWVISLNLTEHDIPGFEITLTSAMGNNWGIVPLTVVLKGRPLDKTTYTSVWKAFEYELVKLRIKGDLVQLSGYYQYQPSFSALLQLYDHDDVDSVWDIVQHVVSGIGVRQPLLLSSIARLWGVSLDEAEAGMHFLRSLGYEVRNNSTNPQLPPGSYLIPYIFPSLTPMSVQLRKSLDPLGDNDDG